jgi:transcriptional regulator with XRE-family HTH domain
MSTPSPRRHPDVYHANPRCYAAGVVDQQTRDDLETQIDGLYAHVGRRVREVRIRESLTQSQLADAVGLTRSSIANLEAGRQRIPLHLLVWIAEILHVKASDLLPEKRTFEDLIVVPDLTEHLANDEERMRSFVKSTVAKVAAPSLKGA